MKPYGLQDKTAHGHGSNCEACQPEGPSANKKRARRDGKREVEAGLREQGEE